MKKLFTLLFALVTSAGTIFAESGTYGDNLTWDLTDGVLTISGTGDMYNYSYYGSPWESYRSSITEVSIDNGVTSIGNYAFYCCSKLTSITIPNSVTSIGDGAFFNCFSLTSIEIPNGVTSIGSRAFSGCTGLISITIPNSVTSIANPAFSGVLNIVYNGSAPGSPWGARSINGFVDGWLVYSDNTKTNLLACSSRATGEIVIPNSVTSIGGSAFYDCTNLTTITIPNSVTSIGGYAFYGCTSLISLTLPNSVTNIRGYAFYGCSGLTSPIYNVHVFAYMPTSYSGAYTIPDGIESIADCAFYDCANLTTITIPNSVTSIGGNAFCNCTGLTFITIPSSVTSIGSSAFSGCTSLTSITIHNSVTSIGSSAFSGCTSLTSITIPNSVTSVGGYAFSDCTGLTSITCEAVTPPTFTGSGGFAYVDKSIPLYVPAQSVDLYKIADQWKDFTNVQTISHASGTCGDNLTWDLTDGVLTISGTGDMYNFSYNGSPWDSYRSLITEVSIGNGVTSIGYSAFFGCTGLTSVNIGNSVTSIGEWAFDGCSSLTSIEIPSSITNIGEWAFEHCTNLVRVSIDSNDVIALGSSYHMYSIFGYQVKEYIIGNSVTAIGDGIFGYCPNLETVSIPNSVTSIGNHAFSNCTNLTSIKIPSSVTSIGYSAFSGCSSLTSIEIPNGVTSIEENTFSSCYRLISIEIPNSITSIGERAFNGCSSLTSIEIPSSVTNIGDYAFNCYSLLRINCLATTPPTLGINVFTKHSCIYVPFGTLQTYKQTTWGEYLLHVVDLSHISSSSGATSVTITLGNEDDAKHIIFCGMESGEEFAGNVIEYIGLEPESEFLDVPFFIRTKEGDYDTLHYSFSTSTLELTTQESKPVSSNTAILLAETNMADIETSCGFEWKRNDAPEDMTPNKVFCPVANGMMAGRLKGLKDEVYYKYRAFYKSAAGNMFYGGWKYIFTGDVTVEFDPIIYTYSAVEVKENEATLKGYALAGSEDFTEQGFEYWAESRANNAPRRANALGEHHIITASGISLRTTLTDLDEGTVYKYRTYAKIGDKTLYGSEMAFTTQGEYQEGQAIEDIYIDAPHATKILHNDQIFILRGDHTYTITGQEVK